MVDATRDLWLCVWENDTEGIPRIGVLARS